MKLQTLRLRAAGITALFVPAALVAGCGPKPTDPAELAQNNEILKTCPKDTKLASKVDIDVSGSGRSADLGVERTAVVVQVARRTAICGGHLRVSAFSVTSAATANLYDQELTLDGATDNARLRHVSALVDDISKQVTETYPSALKKLSPNGSDIIGQYRLAAEYKQQLGSGYRLELTILTDGYQAGGGISLGGRALTKAQANAVVARIPLPKLPGASITVAGIGKVATGKPASSAIVEGTVFVWDAICAKTGAEHCLSVTDYTAAGR